MQVKLPLTKREMAVLFVNNLCTSYYEKLVESTTYNFADMLISSEMIKNAVKSDKLYAKKTIEALPYNPNACYEYHARIQGHLIENYNAFKYKVRELVRANVLKFEKIMSLMSFVILSQTMQGARWM